MKTATRTIEDLNMYQPITHLYELSEPHEGLSHVLVTVATSPDNADEAIVMAANETGAALPDASRVRMWILHRAPDRTHTQALADLGYEVADDSVG